MIKRYLRRECRKPADMKVRQYYQHLLRINNDELPVLPPFAAGQNLQDDEIIDILCFGTPRSWFKEMDRQGFDPITKSVLEVVNFLEQIETAEEGDFQKVDHGQKSGSNNNNDKKKKNSSSSNKGKYCLLHGKGGHSTEECHHMKDQAKKMKNSSSSGEKKSYGNKTWSRKANDATNSSKKELAAFIKKSIKEGVKKELHAIDKKRKASDDDSSTGSVDMHAFDKKPAAKPKRQVKCTLDELMDRDLKGFNYEAMDNLRIEDDKSEGETSC